jgi:hypothetical protein
MWYARIDVENQTFVIEDKEGNIIAVRTMSNAILPNPGREVLMSRAANVTAWNRIYDLVRCANRGSI